MCKTRILKSPTCHHIWLHLGKPCAPGRDLLNCPHFQDGAVNGFGLLPRAGPSKVYERTRWPAPRPPVPTSPWPAPGYFCPYCSLDYPQCSCSQCCPPYAGQEGRSNVVWVRTRRRRKWPAKASPWSCPKCEYDGCYDPRYVRMLKREPRYGNRVGLGPGRSDMGKDCPGWCFMM